MNFILVPFLLGVRLPANEDRWENGPEYTLNATIGTISNLHGDHGKYMGSSLFTALKCRPKEPDRLQCRFENTRIAKLTPDTFKAEAVIPPEDVTYSEFGFGNNTFEIKFNEKGIDSYTFEQDVPNFNYFLNNMYRLVANHLSVLSRIRTIKQVEELENTTVGECFVNYKVSPKKLDSQTTKKEFQLTWLPDEMMDAEQALEMSKEVHLNNCIPHPVYRFGTRHSYGVVPVESIENLRSSVWHMYISNSNFTSESVNTVNVYDLNRELIGSAIDHIRVTLASIDPARSPLKEMSKSTTIGPGLHEDPRSFIELYNR